ncbi:hypothetical protein EBESD8_24340 [Rhodococcus aetherivorans]|nr:hypothetical protein EBESD8_24340 [Rhodococcus aetherivorans]
MAANPAIPTSRFAATLHSLSSILLTRVRTSVRPDTVDPTRTGQESAE